MARISLKNSEIANLREGIVRLNGRTEVVKGASGENLGVVQNPFRFDPRAIYALARTLRQVDAEFQAQEAAKSQLRAAWLATADGRPKNDDEKARTQFELERDLRSIDEQTVEVELHMVPIEFLRLSENTLTPGQLAAIAPMLTGEL